MRGFQDRPRSYSGWSPSRCPTPMGPRTMSRSPQVVTGRILFLRFVCSCFFPPGCPFYFFRCLVTSVGKQRAKHTTKQLALPIVGFHQNRSAKLVLTTL